MNKKLSMSIMDAVSIFVIAGILYLPFIAQYGYYNDDWYLMFSAGTRGASVFWEIFGVDRPLRALVMIPAYTLFGADPLPYNVSAFFFRALGAIGFLWALQTVWESPRSLAFSAAVLFVIYPGFLSQPNAIDYQSHIVGLAAAMFSVAFSMQAVLSQSTPRKIYLFALSILLGWLYLGQMEWYIGIEVLRWSLLLILFNRKDTGLVKGSITGLPLLLAPGVFLIWRIFFFESERGATDINDQFLVFGSSPALTVFAWVKTLLEDSMDTLIFAWWEPLQRNASALSDSMFALSILLTLLAGAAYWLSLRSDQTVTTIQTRPANFMLYQAMLVGLLVLFAGIIPVTLVGRSVDFRSFSRYTLVGSAGTAIVISACLHFISRYKKALFFLLMLSATLTHHANGARHAEKTAEDKLFWHQVAWRIPQLEPGTTLVAHYPEIIEEDYFIWGPANLIYYPDSKNDKYTQPTLYAALLSEDTIEKAGAEEGQDFSNRRSIRTYPNYRKIMILTKPTKDSCVHVIDNRQIEISTWEDPRIVALASYSEVEHIYLDDSFRAPPLIPFDLEPSRDSWCFLYEKASYARQIEKWSEVRSLGEKAFALDLHPVDQIEWMPFIQAYAIFADVDRLEDIQILLTDADAKSQACSLLEIWLDLQQDIRTQASKMYCN